MKKISLLVFVLFTMLLVQTASAQKNNIGVNVAAALPIGDFGDIVKAGIGGDLSFDHYFNDNIHVGIEAGIRSFKIDMPDIPAIPGFMDFSIDYKESMNIIPIQLTAGYHMDANSMLDLYGELGAGIFIISPMFEGGESDSNFGFSPRIGAAFEMSDNLFFDVNANYTMVTTEGNSINWIGINAGILYTL